MQIPHLRACKPRKRAPLRYGSQVQRLPIELHRPIHDLPCAAGIPIAFHKGKILIRIISNPHNQMIDRPIWLRLHPREIVETAPALVQHIALTVEVHREKFADPTLIDRADLRMIAKFPRICVEQYMRLRHAAKLLLIHIT